MSAYLPGSSGWGVYTSLSLTDTQFVSVILKQETMAVGSISLAFLPRPSAPTPPIPESALTGARGEETPRPAKAQEARPKYSPGTLRPGHSWGQSPPSLHTPPKPEPGSLAVIIVCAIFLCQALYLINLIFFH